MTNFILDTAAKPFSDVAWNNRDILTCAPCIDLSPGSNRDGFIGECKLWWDNAPGKVRAIHLMRFGVALMPGAWLGPQTPAQYREQLLGGFSRLGNEAVWLDELASRFDTIGMWPDLCYISYESQSECFEWDDANPAWAFVEALTGDKRLPRTLRYTTAIGFTKIKSLSAWLKTRTPYVKKCWREFFHPMQWGQLRGVYQQSRFSNVPVCSWNQPNYTWTPQSTWADESANKIGSITHLPMYDSTPDRLNTYREALKYAGKRVIANVRPDQPFTEQLKLIDEFDVGTSLVFCDPTRTDAWMRGINPMLDQIRTFNGE